ncbi:MAG: ATP-dependent DNA helicase RecG, partial [Tyzzerella sp.]|nr:ATP-dependent DNA helicase RecG [Candidatus Fimicola merdigallinarum]
MYLDSPVTAIKSIGPEKSRKLSRLGILTVKDLIEHFPRDYEDRSQVVPISEIKLNEENTFRGRVRGIPEDMRVKNLRIVRARIEDSTGGIVAVWYNQPYMKKAFKEGAEYIFTGKAVRKYNNIEIQSPEFEIVSEGSILSGGRIVPVYSSTSGISQKMLRSIIKDTLDYAGNQIHDFIPTSIRKKYKLCDRNYAVSNIHFPESNESFFIARRRLVFEELFMLQTALLKMKSSVNKGKSGIVFKNINCAKEILNALPFELTDAQKKVMREIVNDIKSGKSMNRLVQGDVGSGKTAVALVTAFIAIRNGYQSALMAPTEVLAGQHYEFISKILDSLGIKTVLLTGSLKKKEKEKALELIKSGEAKMVIGTHAVIQENVEFQKLGMVITDEQHRFGVRQRGTLSEKGENPHVLVMTATPIPRTLALILYGDLDISIIDHLPPGRQKIDTLSVNSSYHERIYSFIRKEVDRGRQVYIICPMIDENDKLDVQDVTTYTEKLKNEIFSDYSVECMHGKIKPQKKQEIMEEFAKNNINILVSTTVIEVGINVPNATIMMIENAERFGLAQLHQLRGRVGRGSEKSYCILVCDSKSKVAKERMNMMTKSSDGFEISEMDLKLRGPGEFFGTRQHGLPEMKIANLYKDMNILKEAQKASLEIMNMDIENDDEYKLLKMELDKAFQVEN